MTGIPCKHGLFGLILLTLTACSGIEHQALTERSSPSLDNTLAVMGIKWVEVYNDTEEKENRSLISYELLNDQELIKRKRVAEGKKELYRPLYYMNTFEFEFSDDKGKNHRFIRFGKHMLQYENAAIYELTPGVYTLNAIRLRQLRFEENLRSTPERWKRFEEQVKEEFGSWELPQGKIAYLGDLTFYFKTKRFVFGIITPEELIASIKLEKIVIEDSFDGMKAALQKEKPWFPAADMINMSKPNKWIYYQPPEEEAEEDTPKQKNKNSFF